MQPTPKLVLTSIGTAVFSAIGLVIAFYTMLYTRDQAESARLALTRNEGTGAGRGPEKGVPTLGDGDSALIRHNKELTERVNRLTAELSQMRKASQDSNRTTAQLLDKLEARESERASNAEELARVRESIATLKAQISEQRGELEKAQRELAKAEDTVKFLRQGRRHTSSSLRPSYETHSPHDQLAVALQRQLATPDDLRDGALKHKIFRQDFEALRSLVARRDNRDAHPTLFAREARRILSGMFELLRSLDRRSAVSASQSIQAARWLRSTLTLAATAEEYPAD